jgi:hypothetical protein
VVGKCDAPLLEVSLSGAHGLEKQKAESGVYNANRYLRAVLDEKAYVHFSKIQAVEFDHCCKAGSNSQASERAGCPVKVILRYLSSIFVGVRFGWEFRQTFKWAERN